MVKKVLKSIGRGVLIVIYAPIGAFSIGAIAAAIAAYVVSLGPRFGPAMVAAGIETLLVVFGGVIFAVLPSNVRQRMLGAIKQSIPCTIKQSIPDFKSWVAQHQKRLMVIALIFSFLPLVFFGVSDATERYSRASDAEFARQVFGFTHTSLLDHADTKFTLAEYERARRRLEGEWPTPDDSLPISLHLFSNIRHLQREIGVDWAGGAVRCQPERITIFVSLEKTPEFFTEDERSQTPLHEMVHALMCQSIGQQAFHSIPGWYHEGVAQFHEDGGFLNRAKTDNRINVWFKRKELMQPERFCTYRYQGSHSVVSLFYGTAWEFVRSLATGHGEDALNEVVADVGAGTAFEDSMRDHFGGTCVELYGDWLRSL